jgi:hypothetical protein
LLGIFRLEFLEQILNINLNVGLLVRIAVLFLLDVLHERLVLALLLPVELLVDVAGCNRYRQVFVNVLHNVVLNFFVFDSLQVWVLIEVICDD